MIIESIKAMHDDDKRPRCPNEATLSQLRIEDFTEVRHGSVARYPHDAMVRLLAGEGRLPRWRRVLRWLRRI